MAIDTSMYGVNLPAGTYSTGDVIPLKNIRGPAVVRDGYGPARLKRIYCGATNTAASGLVRGHVIVKNSNWVDEIANLVSPPSTVSLAENSSNIQRGHDCALIPNSGWDVAYVVDETVTSTSDTDIFCLIDVDYPSVQAVQNPREASGTPMSMIRKDSIAVSAFGSIETAAWSTFNIDPLKAGSKYLLVEAGVWTPSLGTMGFLSVSGAAGQNGLERIIPAVVNIVGNMRFFLDYSTPLVKGPMNLNYLAIGTAGTVTTVTELDWVKR